MLRKTPSMALLPALARLPPLDCDWVFLTYADGLVQVLAHGCHSKGPLGRDHHYQRFRCPHCPLSIHLHLFGGRGYLRYPRRYPWTPKMTEHVDGCPQLLRYLWYV